MLTGQILTNSEKFLKITYPLLGAVHMIPGQRIAPGQLTDPRVNFASVHGLTTVTVHMSFSFQQGNFERQVTLCTTPGTRLAEGTFLHVN